MKSMIKFIAAATMMSAFITPASAADLKVYSNLFGSTANIVVWDGDHPVSGGTVVIKDKAGRVTAKGNINSKGRANLSMMSKGYGDYTVLAESGNQTGTGRLVIDDRQIGS